MVKEPRAVGSEPKPPAADSQGSIHYVGPDTYILLDAEGRPQAMPGMTYEDFMEAWRQSQGARTERQARFAVDSVAIRGKTKGDLAELRFDVIVRLLTDERVDVPLGLVGAILRRPPEIGPAEEVGDEKPAGETQTSKVTARPDYLDFDPARGGYVAHLAGRAGERRRASLDLLVPLVRDGTETTLALNCPRSLTSMLALDVDSAVSEAFVSNGALLNREPVTNGGTRLTAAGLAGQFRISWSGTEATASELSTVLSAAGAIQVSIDGRTVRSDARLTVRSYGGSFDRFRVRLPPGATLIPSRAVTGDKEPEYRISLDDDRSGDASQTARASRGQTVLVQLASKQQGPVVVELSTEQPLELTEADIAVELKGFEVLGAARQFGDVALRVADDWQARWDAGQYVRQVDTRELESALQQAGLSGAFQYDRQPWTLGVRVSARQIRVQVTPEYELECLPDEARLRAHFTYQILGGRAYEFRVNLRGWERTADSIESGGVIDRDRTMLTEEGVLVLPLSQTSLRRAEVTVMLRRGVPRDPRRIELPLPIPLTESVATGDLVVNSSPGIELMPDSQRSAGLTATPVMAESGATTDESRSDFQFRCFQPDAVFVANRINRPRDVAVDVTSQINVFADRAEVRELVVYDVRYEPITELLFEVPAGLPLNEETVELALVTSANEQDDDDGTRDDQTPETLLRFTSGAESSAVTGTGESYRARTVLPQPRLGRFAVEFRYVVDRPSGTSGRENWAIPLPRPADGRSGEWQATVRTPREQTAMLGSVSQASTWREVVPMSAATSTSSGGMARKRFIATRPEPSLPLSIQAVDVDIPSATTVERAWLQTWLTGSTRQDRAAFRFRTEGGAVTVELPPDVAVDEVEVLLDGQRVEQVLRAAGRITVRFPWSNGDNPELDARPDQLQVMPPRTLELRYRRPSIDRVVTRRRLTPPQMVGTSSMVDVYWQIVLPGDRHVIDSPPQLVAASEWQWLGSFWGRRPTKTQGELEQWVGASVQQTPTGAQNEYLYSGLAPVSSIELITAPRWFIVLAASGSALALALAWIYLPPVRRRWLVVTAACLLAALAAAYPTPAMLLAQASVLGLILAGVAALIARLAVRPSQWYLPVPGGSSHRQLTPQLAPQLTPQLTPRVESAVVEPIASSVASTAPTAPLPVPESKS